MGQFVDITGNKYGRLTVIERAENQNKKPMWLCKCDCGNTKIVRADSLKNGSTLSCGCLLKESTSQRFLKDIIGKKFGRWTIIKRAKSVNGISKYLCKCQCGTEKEIFANQLLSNQTKSCGCLVKDTNHRLHFIDMTNQKFGMLKVIKRVENIKNKSGSSNTRWLCKCDCGKEKIFYGANLRNGTKSCGCVDISYGESIVKEYLDELKISYEREYTFNDCRNILCLPFDFYLPDYNTCIEYDGMQHYKPIEYFGGNKQLKKQQIRDKIKNEYCKNNNITLLRLPYYLNNDEIKKKIINILNP